MHINTFPFTSFSHKRVKLYHSLFSLAVLSLRLFFPVFLGVSPSRHSCGGSVTESGQLQPSVGASALHPFTWLLKLRSCRRGEKRRGGDKGSILEQEGRGLDRSVQRQYLLGWQLSDAEQNGAGINGNAEWSKKQQNKRRADTIRCMQMNLKNT